MGREQKQGRGGAASAELPGTPENRVQAVFHPPPSQFDGCFTTFYQLKLDVAEGGEVTDSLQPEWANLRFFGGSLPHSQIGDTSISGVRYGVTGPSSLACHFRLGTVRMWGIGILPLGWARLVDAQASGYRNAMFNGTKDANFAKFDCLSDLLCDPEGDEEEQLAAIIDVMERFMRPSRDEAKIVRVHDALVNGDHLAVADLADVCGMSIRTLERVCRRYFGFTPKRLMRRQRFTRSLTSFMLHRGALWTQSMDAGYHDQAQFTREFSEFMTMTPSKYASLDHPVLASFMEARERIWGSAAQTLDTPSQSSDSGD